MHHKAKGIVIKERAKGETSKLLTVLTEFDGVITVNAKGARSILASNLKSVQLFAFSNMLLYVKNGFYTLVDASLIEDFYSVRENIDSFALASYFCEVAGSVAIRDSDNSTVLQLLLNTLYALSKNLVSFKQIKAVFEIRLACILGFEPEMDYCEVCEKPLSKTKNKVLDPSNGVFLCAECSGKANEYTSKMYPVSQSVYDAFKYIIDANNNKIFSFSVDEKAFDQLGELSEIYLHLRLERKYKTLYFLKSLQKEL